MYAPAAVSAPKLIFARISYTIETFKAKSGVFGELSPGLHFRGFGRGGGGSYSTSLPPQEATWNQALVCDIWVRYCLPESLPCSHSCDFQKAKPALGSGRLPRRALERLGALQRIVFILIF